MIWLTSLQPRPSTILLTVARQIRYKTYKKTALGNLRARDLTLDEAVGARLRDVHLSILARVLDVLVPAQVCRDG